MWNTYITFLCCWHVSRVGYPWHVIKTYLLQGHSLFDFALADAFFGGNESNWKAHNLQSKWNPPPKRKQNVRSKNEEGETTTYHSWCQTLYDWNRVHNHAIQYNIVEYVTVLKLYWKQYYYVAEVVQRVSAIEDEHKVWRGVRINHHQNEKREKRERESWYSPKKGQRHQFIITHKKKINGYLSN